MIFRRIQNIYLTKFLYCIVFIFLSISAKAEESILFIEWKEEKDALQYKIEISDSKKFSKILFSQNVKETTILIEPDKNLKFARVAGIDKSGSLGEYSSIFPLRPRIIPASRIPTKFKDAEIYKNKSQESIIEEAETFNKISEKRIHLKEREKANNEILSKMVDAESGLNLILKNIYQQKSKLNDLELEILKKENQSGKELERITQDARLLLDLTKTVNRETNAIIAPIQLEVDQSQKIFTQIKKEIETIAKKLSQNSKNKKSNGNPILEDKFSELKTYSEEETEKMDDLVQKVKSLNKKKIQMNKQIKNFKKEIIYFQSTIDDLKQKSSEPSSRK